MLSVSIALIPHGDDNRTQLLAYLDIINDGTHHDRPDYGNYVVKFHPPGLSYRRGMEDQEEAETFYIKDHNRDDGFIPLVVEALRLVEDSCRKSDGLLEEQITHSMKP